MGWWLCKYVDLIKKSYDVFTIMQQAEQKFFAHILVHIFSTKSAEYTQEGL